MKLGSRRLSLALDDRGAQTAPFLQNGWSYRLVDRCGASVGPSDHEYDKRFCQAYRYRSSESTIDDNC